MGGEKCNTGIEVGCAVAHVGERARAASMSQGVRGEMGRLVMLGMQSLIASAFIGQAGHFGALGQRILRFARRVKGSEYVVSYRGRLP